MREGNDLRKTHLLLCPSLNQRKKSSKMRFAVCESGGQYGRNFKEVSANEAEPLGTGITRSRAYVIVCDPSNSVALFGSDPGLGK